MVALILHLGRLLFIMPHTKEFDVWNRLSVGDSSPSSLSNGWPCIVCLYRKIIGNQ